MANDKVVDGILGTGRIGRMHARNSAYRPPGIFLKTVADCRPDDAWAKSLGVPVCAVDYQEVLEDPEIKAVVNATHPILRRTLLSLLRPWPSSYRTDKTDQ